MVRDWALFRGVGNVTIELNKGRAYTVDASGGIDDIAWRTSQAQVSILGGCVRDRTQCTSAAEGAFSASAGPFEPGLGCDWAQFGHQSLDLNPTLSDGSRQSVREVERREGRIAST